MSRDEWRISSAAIQLEMERIAGLLEKSVHFQSRTTTAHPVRERHEAVCPTPQRDVSSHEAAELIEKR
jgi:hypothetical protein